MVRNIDCEITTQSIFPVVSLLLRPAVGPPSPTSKCSKTSKIKPSPKMGPDFFIVWADQGRSGISDARKPRIRYFPLWCGSYRFIRHGHAPPGSMSGSLKTILRGSTSRVNMPNAQSNDCARSPTNDGNGNATGRDLAAGSLNAPPRLWQLPYTKLSPPYHSPAQRRFGISGAE